MRGRWWKTIAMAVVVAMVTSCAHIPGQPDKPLFPSFKWCVAANLVLAAAGGVTVAILTEKLFKRTDAAVGSGIATTAVISVVAWHECAKVHSTTRVDAQRSRDDFIADRRLSPELLSALAFEELGARVDRDATVVNFDLGFAFIADSRDEKDISVTIRHKLDIVQMVRHEDKLVLADATGSPLLDASRRPIRVKDFASLPEGQLVYQTFYDKIDREIIQQGSRKLIHELPAAVKGLQYPLPMRYTVSVDAGRFTGEQTLEFYLPDVPERPKTFAAKSAAVITTKSGPPPGILASRTQQPAPLVAATPTLPPTRTPPAPPSPREIGSETRGATTPPAQYVAQKVVALYESAGGPKQAGRLQPNTLLQVLEISTLTPTDGRPAVWLKVSSRQGVVGWVRKADVVELK